VRRRMTRPYGRKGHIAVESTRLHSRFELVTVTERFAVAVQNLLPIQVTVTMTHCREAYCVDGCGRIVRLQVPVSKCTVRAE
jgi:hypothetical protein